MTTKSKVILAVLFLVLAFASGRYSVQSPDTTSTTDTKVDKDTHTKKTIVTTKEPDGKETTTTVVERDTSVKTDTQTSNTVIQAKRNTTNLSLIVGLDLTDPHKPAYGLSLTKQVLGPVTVGAYGLTNGVVGLSLGVNF